MSNGRGPRSRPPRPLLPTWQTARDVALNRLNVLLGHPPGSRDALLEQGGELQPLDQQVLVAAPAKVLASRPDVRAAERRYAASLSAKDAASAELFPDISLTALFGAQSATPFSATPWGIGVGLVQPVLNFGRIESQIDSADAQQKQAFLAYQQTVLEALENMENALSGYGHEAARNVSLPPALRKTAGPWTLPSSNMPTAIPACSTCWSPNAICWRRKRPGLLGRQPAPRSGDYLCRRRRRLARISLYYRPLPTAAQAEIGSQLE